MPKKILCYCLCLILAGMAAATIALAQPGGGVGGGFQERFREIKRTQMGPALGVNQQIVDQLLQIEQRYRPQRHQMILEAKAEFQRLEQALNQPNPSNQEIKAILDNIKRKEQEINALKQRQDVDEMAILTPVQYGKYIMYQKKLMREARSVKGEGQGETAPIIPQGPREIPVSRPAR
jgi:Spy/CpxP family protein refolding chaperone